MTRAPRKPATLGQDCLFPVEVHTEATQTIFFMFLFVCLIVFLSNAGGFNTYFADKRLKIENKTRL